jgi:hypothetical protein
MKYLGKELQAMVYGDSETLDLVEDSITGHGRWVVNHRGIFKDKTTNKYYQTYWRVGATECQEEVPFEYEYEKEVECDEVEQKEIISLTWVVKEN